MTRLLVYCSITTFVHLCSYLYLISAEYDYPVARPSTLWANNISNPHTVTFNDGSIARIILLRASGTETLSFGCGFICKGTCISNYLFSVFVVIVTSDNLPKTNDDSPEVVWSANHNNPVGLDATTEFTWDGDLVLRNGSSLLWSTNTGGKSVAGLNLTNAGNLVLFDVNNSVVWQSFDHPTDTLLLGQKLLRGQNLTSSTSFLPENERQQGVYYTLHLTNRGIFCYIESPEGPVSYFTSEFDGLKYISSLNESLSIITVDPSDTEVIPVPPAYSKTQYIRFGSDGHLKAYDLYFYRSEVGDLFSKEMDYCAYPMPCGRYGICSRNQCFCPKLNIDGTSYFKAISDHQPDLGCSLTIPLTCNASQYHKVLKLENVSYFAIDSDIENTHLENCKNACLRSCSCKAAIFQYLTNSSRGDCYLPSSIFSLIDTNQKLYNDYSSLVFVKVQLPSIIHKAAKKNWHKTLTGVMVATSISILVIIGFVVLKLRRKKKASMLEEDYLQCLPGMPMRFSFDELKVATNDFSKKIGEGGFGEVFEGALEDKQRVAVKCLECFTHVKRSFLAEIETIGRVHHFNLVRLIGFCDGKSKLFLVYEYMINGSLDKWIYNRKRESILGWESRKKIILDITRGLAYLHEDCRQKIIHLDIKPQNILLDENYNAKVADFGLSKLIDRNQSQVMTTMRGTPGYLAPEWLTSGITEKVDVYSFGVVVLETLCGRKNVDILEPQESRHLLRLFQQCLEEERLLDLVDKHSEDMQEHGAEVVEMMKVASWCLQNDYTRRPSMSMILKVIEGGAVVEPHLDYNFSGPGMQMRPTPPIPLSTSVVPSVLSAPR